MAQDPIDKARAEREARRQKTLADAAAREAELQAIREQGDRERERDAEADRQAEAKRAKDEATAREKREKQEREDAEKLHAAVTQMLAEREARIDREAAAALKQRLKDEAGLDPSLGPQTVLDPRGPLARAARGGAARDMAGNALALELASVKT